MKKLLLILFFNIFLYAESCNDATNRVNFYFFKAKEQLGIDTDVNWCKVEYAMFRGFEASNRAKDVCGALYSDEFMINKLETYKIAKEKCKEQKLHFR